MGDYRRGGSGYGGGRDRHDDAGRWGGGRDRYADGGKNGGRQRDYRPWGGGGGGDYGRGGDYGAEWHGGGKGGKGGGLKVEEDTSRDWECEKCGARNFAKRDECFKCKAPRPRPPEEAQRDPAAERERKLKAAIAMGIDPSMAEGVIMDPRFAESIEQYERMQKAQEDQQRAMQAQQQAAAAPDASQLIAMAMSQGYSAEQAQQYVAQYLQQHQAQQAAAAPAAPAAASVAAAAPPPPDAAQLLAAAMAQGFTQEQAQLYVQQYLQQHQQQQAALPEGSSAAAAGQQAAVPAAEAPPAQPVQRVAIHANVPLILNIDEGSRGQYRATLKAVIYEQQASGRRSFQDVLAKGPWRRRRESAMKDQEEMATAFKYDGSKGVDKRVRELEDTTWKDDDLKGIGGQAEADPVVEDDDFDAEAESEAEPEAELEYPHEELPVKVRGLQQFEGPISTWEEGVQRGCIAPPIAYALAMMQLQRPTLIQRYALPLIARSGMDLLAQAQTGSGKTLAFVIPIVSRLLMTPPVTRPFFPGPMAQASPIALMLSPTRELAIQTAKNVSELMRLAGSTLSVITMYGGETISQQLKPIEKQNQDIICATPGRLLDAIDSGKVSLMFATTVVLDEADQMLDLAVGLEGTVTQVTDGRDLPRNDGRQTLLFSATMPDFQTKQFHAVLKSLPNRLKLRVGHYNEDEKGGSCRHISQTFLRVHDMHDRWGRLGRDLMEMWGSTTQMRQGKGIIFTNRIAFAVPLEQALRRVGISSGQLHGKQTQDVREEVVKRFRSGEFEMLIASNVASRGLDFPDIRLVVQFELPKTVEIYTHRIGRTGRNGQAGAALSYFWDAADKNLAKPLVEFLQLNEQAVPGWLGDLVHPPSTRSGGGGYGGYGGYSGRHRSRSRSHGREHWGRGGW